MIMSCYSGLWRETCGRGEAPGPASFADISPGIPVIALFQRLAATKIGLAPYPWLVIPAHLRFHLVDAAEVLSFCYPLQKRADCGVLPCPGIPHLDEDDGSEILG